MFDDAGGTTDENEKLPSFDGHFIFYDAFLGNAQARKCGAENASGPAKGRDLERSNDPGYKRSHDHDGPYRRNKEERTSE
jgi:hypothetical protein